MLISECPMTANDCRMGNTSAHIHTLHITTFFPCHHRERRNHLQYNLIKPCYFPIFGKRYLEDILYIGNKKINDTMMTKILPLVTSLARRIAICTQQFST